MTTTIETTATAEQSQPEANSQQGRRLRHLRNHRGPRQDDDPPILVPVERRGLLQCPIVGVAVDDWTVEHLIGARAGGHPRHG